MKTQDFTVISDKVVAVTTVAFSKDKELVDELNNTGFKQVKTNIAGKRFTKEELIEFLSDVDGVIVGLDKIDDSAIKDAKKLKVISKYGVGLDNINFDDCTANGVEVRHTQGVNKRSVAEQALGCMLMLSRNLYVTANDLKQGSWNKSGGTQVSGKTVGIIGVGHIGKDLIELLKPFNCRILVNDIIDQSEYYKANNLTEVTKDEIFKNADIISIHTPLTAELNALINKETLSMMRPSTIVINTARGGLVNQDDLKWALQNKIIAGAAIDAYEVEPPNDQEFVNIPNLIATPHIGGNAKEAVHAMGIASIHNLVEFFKEEN